jgi:hypothetical protein
LNWGNRLLIPWIWRKGGWPKVGQFKAKGAWSCRGPLLIAQVFSVKPKENCLLRVRRMKTEKEALRSLIKL